MPCQIFLEGGTNLRVSDEYLDVLARITDTKSPTGIVSFQSGDPECSIVSSKVTAVVDLENTE